VKTGNNF